MRMWLDGQTLQLEDVWTIAQAEDPWEITLTPAAWEKVTASRSAVERMESGDLPVYGVNTGFGKLSDVRIAREDVADLQVNLIRSHACAVGPYLPRDVVRAMLLLRANALAGGYSGIRTDTLQRMLDCLTYRVHPCIPSQGSLGASGDLAPLAHLALALMGEGVAERDGVVGPSVAALQAAGLSPVKLAAKEGLALINGTQAMTAVGVLTLLRAEFLADMADGIGALTLQAQRGIVDAFDASLHDARPHAGQVEAAASMRAWLAGSALITRQGELRVQDAYSLRCMPQVHGASRQAMQYVRTVLTVEVNAATDNPLILDDGARAISGGHFHGQPVALAMDFLKIAVAELANISERRTERLVNPTLSGLPAFLARTPGLSSGLMILQYIAASLVSENKVLAHPASVDSIPSSAGQEDHVSMGTTAARQAADIVRNVSRVLAIEAIAAAEAIDIQNAKEGLSPRTRQLYDAIRAIVSPVVQDRSLSEEIERLADVLHERALVTEISPHP